MNELDGPGLHHEALSALERADLALAHVPDLVVDGPNLLEHVIADFLDEVLAGDAPGASLVELDVVEAHDGMTSRRKWRLEWKDAGRRAGLPSSVFVKATPDVPYLRETLSVLHMAENEVNFYSRLQPELPDLAPQAYYARSYPGGRFLLVIEDLAGRGIRPFTLADDCSLKHAYADADRLCLASGVLPVGSTDLSRDRSGQGAPG
jgi:hypothetical protein